MRGEVLERPVLSSWAQVLDYCRASMGFASKEQFRMLCSACPEHPYPPFMALFPERLASSSRATREV